MENIKVSIIIPIYNSEKYIDKCLESVVNQSLKEIEIIIINDGSTDNTLNIAKEIAKKDNRIKIFTQHNKGAAIARNLGILKSSGKYIGFVDIDDYIEREMYFELYYKAIEGNYDIVTCSFVEEGTSCHNYFENALIEKNEIEGEEIKELYFKYIIEDKSIGYLPLWNKIFKKEFIIENNLYIDKEMVFGEDRIFCREAFLRAERIANVNKILYHYLKVNDDSITMKYSISKVEYYLQDRREMVRFIVDNIKDRKMLEKGLDIYNSRIFYKLIYYSLMEIRTDKEWYKKYKNIKKITNIREIRLLSFNKIKSSISMKFLLALLKIKFYPLIYICLFIKIKKLKLDNIICF